MKDILDFEGLYAVTEDGRVWSHRQKRFLKGSPTQHGYRGVVLIKAKVTVRRALVHRLVIETFLGKNDDMFADHINRDPTDNRLANLRYATRSQNASNARMDRRNTSGFRNVYYCKGKWRQKRWMVMLTFQGKQMNFGQYSTAEEAAQVASNKRLQLFGEFAA